MWGAFFSWCGRVIKAVARAVFAGFLQGITEWAYRKASRWGEPSFA